MHFKQKLVYMALGSLFTLAGYVLASIIGDVTAQTQKASVEFDEVTCRSLKVVDSQNRVRVVLEPTESGRVMDLFNKDGDSVYSVGDNSFNRPKLSEVRSFTIYAKEGKFTVFNLNGKIVEQKPENAFQDGEMRFTLLGGEKAMMYGNLGIAEVRVVQEKGSTTFIETTLFGNQHILIIYDDWDEKERGFRFTYTRNTEDRLLSHEIMRSTYKGIAKPDIGR